VLSHKAISEELCKVLPSKFPLALPLISIFIVIPGNPCGFVLSRILGDMCIKAEYPLWWPWPKPMVSMMELLSSTVIVRRISYVGTSIRIRIHHSTLQPVIWVRCIITLISLTMSCSICRSSIVGYVNNVCPHSTTTRQHETQDKQQYLFHCHFLLVLMGLPGRIELPLYLMGKIDALIEAKGACRLAKDYILRFYLCFKYISPFVLFPAIISFTNAPCVIVTIT
jgi:hypothetical protein